MFFANWTTLWLHFGCCTVATHACYTLLHIPRLHYAFLLAYTFGTLLVHFFGTLFGTLLYTSLHFTTLFSYTLVHIPTTLFWHTFLLSYTFLHFPPLHYSFFPTLHYAFFLHFSYTFFLHFPTLWYTFLQFTMLSSYALLQFTTPLCYTSLSNMLELENKRMNHSTQDSHVVPHHGTN
jgi:hypothetical protein